MGLSSCMKNRTVFYRLALNKFTDFTITKQISLTDTRMFDRSQVMSMTSAANQHCRSDIQGTVVHVTPTFIIFFVQKNYQ